MTTGSPVSSRDMDWALTVAQRRLASAPGDPSVHNALGVIEAAQGDTARALARFEQALALCPTYAEASLNKGLALELLGRPAEAFDAFIQACALTPGYGDAEEKVEL